MRCVQVTAGPPLGQRPCSDADLGAQVIIVEGDADIGSSLERTQRGQDNVVAWVTTARAAQKAVGPATALVILDLGCPMGDGPNLCKISTSWPFIARTLSARLEP